MSEEGDLYFRQVAIGPMQNFIYFIGSRRTREVMVVDPAWTTEGILEFAEQEELKITGALVTHYHPDHVGGAMGPFAVPGGVSELVGQVDARVHVNKHEADGLIKITGLSETDLVRHDSGDVIEIGDVSVELIHTPGHTPGSQCFHVRQRLVTGDTLFVNGCGRVDLPGGDAGALRESLQILSKLPDQTTICPGHDYGATPNNTMAEQKQSNWALIDALP